MSFMRQTPGATAKTFFAISLSVVAETSLLATIAFPAIVEFLVSDTNSIPRQNEIEKWNTNFYLIESIVKF